MARLRTAALPALRRPALVVGLHSGLRAMTPPPPHSRHEQDNRDAGAGSPLLTVEVPASAALDPPAGAAKWKVEQRSRRVSRPHRRCGQFLQDAPAPPGRRARPALDPSSL